MAYAKVRKSTLGFMREPDTTTQARGLCHQKSLFWFYFLIEALIFQVDLKVVAQASGLCIESTGFQPVFRIVAQASSLCPL